MKKYETKVKDGDKDVTLVFDPEAMFMAQDEEIEKILVDAGYGDILSEYFATDDGSKAMRTALEGGANAAKKKATDAEKAENGRMVLSLAAVCGRIHNSLIKKSLRIPLLTHILVPEGMEYGPESIARVQELTKRMKREQMEGAFASFFDSGKIFRDGFRAYLVGMNLVAKPTS